MDACRIYDNLCCHIAGEKRYNRIKLKTKHNSSQKDFGEGNLYCLCSPTCMLEYSLGNGNWEEVGANASLSDEERQEIDDNREIDVLSAILWERIEDLLDEDEFIEDFAEHRERIQELLELNYLDENKEAVLRRILSEIE